MSFGRSIAVGVVALGATAGICALGAGSASAVGITPLPGGVQVEFTHDETVWVDQSNVGLGIYAIPNPSAQSFGLTLDAAAALAQTFPQGRVSFSAFGPLEAPQGEIVAFIG